MEEKDIMSNILTKIGKMFPNRYKKALSLTAEEERFLVQRITEYNDQEARELLILANLSLVFSIGKEFKRKFSHFCFEEEDFYMEGVIGLIEAINDSDPKKNFKNYKGVRIKRQIIEMLRSHSRIIKIPRSIMDRIRKVSGFIEEFETQKGNKPTAEEISSATYLSETIVRETLVYIRNDHCTVFFDDLFENVEEDERPDLISNLQKSLCDSPEEVFFKRELLETKFKEMQEIIFSLRQNIVNLKQYFVFMKRYGLDDMSFSPKKQAEIWRGWKLPESTVSQYISDVFLFLESIGITKKYFERLVYEVSEYGGGEEMKKIAEIKELKKLNFSQEECDILQGILETTIDDTDGHLLVPTDIVNQLTNKAAGQCFNFNTVSAALSRFESLSILFRIDRLEQTIQAAGFEFIFNLGAVRGVGLNLRVSSPNNANDMGLRRIQLELETIAKLNTSLRIKKEAFLQEIANIDNSVKSNEKKNTSLLKAKEVLESILPILNNNGNGNKGGGIESKFL